MISALQKFPKVGKDILLRNADEFVEKDSRRIEKNE